MRRLEDEQFINALRGAFGDPNRHRKQKAILDLLEYITPANAGQVHELFREFNKRGIKQEFAWGMFWTRWGEIDGAGALDALFTGPATDQRNPLQFHAGGRAGKGRGLAPRESRIAVSRIAGWRLR